MRTAWKDDIVTITKTTVSGRSLRDFCALAFGLSWLFWIPVALSGQHAASTVWAIPYLLGGFGPSVAGIIMTCRNAGRARCRAFWSRVVGFGRISLGWYLFIVLVFPATFGLSILLSVLLGQPPAGFLQVGRIAANPLALIGIVIIGIVAGPLSEELGWRGYALDWLQARWNPIIASLILGLIWWAWHLPLFFIVGTTHYTWGLGTAEFWLFLVGVVPLSVLMTWVYNANERSILAAILLHFTYNFTLGLAYPLPAQTLSIQVVLMFVVAAGVVLGIRPPPRGADPR